MPQTLEVYGDEQVEVVPDIAYGLVGVMTIGKHVFTIGNGRNQREEKDRSVYRVNNMVDITVRDLYLIGQVLGVATRAGANQ